MADKRGDVLTVKEAAEYLHLSKKTVRAYLGWGLLPGAKVDNRWGVRHSELVAFQRGQWVPQGTRPPEKGTATRRAIELAIQGGLKRIQPRDEPAKGVD